VGSVVITLLSIIAVVEMNNFGRVVSLMGALLGCPLAFVFPPLIHYQIVLGNSNGWRKSCNHVVKGNGVLTVVRATLTTFSTWKDGGEGRPSKRSMIKKSKMRETQQARRASTANTRKE
jgi:hypothetical protein